MARSLQELQERYNSAAKQKLMDSSSHRQARGGKGSGPKDAGKSIRRLMTYVRGYRLLLLLVLFSMLISTLTSLMGTYLMAPIINKLYVAVKPDYVPNLSAVEQAADGWRLP